METIEEFEATIAKIPTIDGNPVLQITTITVSGSLKTKVDLNELKTKDTIFTDLKYEPGKKKTVKKQIITKFGCYDLTKPEKQPFYNCLMMKKDKISVKIFTNGRFQIAGPRTIRSVYETMADITDLTGSEVAESKINMISSNFKILKRVRQNKLKDLINTTASSGPGLFEMAVFNRSNFAGVNIKYITESGARTSVFVFATGAVCVTGSKNSKDLYETFEKISTLIRGNSVDLLY